MRRRLNLLTALLLLLCVAAAALWVRSDWVREQWVVSAPHRLYLVTLRTGGVGINASRVPRRVREGWKTRRERPFREPHPLLTQPQTALNRLGFFCARKARPDHVMGGLTFSYWCVLLACAVPPALRLCTATRRKRRARLNVCPACGYDLTGNVSGMCPECGRAGSAAG